MGGAVEIQKSIIIPQGTLKSRPGNSWSEANSKTRWITVLKTICRCKRKGTKYEESQMRDRFEQSIEEFHGTLGEEENKEDGSVYDF